MDKKGGKISFGLENISPPWKNTGWVELKVGPEWKKYQFAISNPADWPSSHINIRLGDAAQEIEIGGLKITNYQRQISPLKLEREINPPPPTPEPKLGRNLPFWAPTEFSAPAFAPADIARRHLEVYAEGKTENEIPVPEFWDAAPGFVCDQATYERTVAVPSDWTGKRIFVEFEGVNQIADVYVNDQHVGQHVGGWTSFNTISRLMQRQVRVSG